MLFSLCQSKDVDKSSLTKSKKLDQIHYVTMAPDSSETKTPRLHGEFFINLLF